MLLFDLPGYTILDVDYNLLTALYMLRYLFTVKHMFNLQPGVEETCEHVADDMEINFCTFQLLKHDLRFHIKTEFVPFYGPMHRHISQGIAAFQS